MTTTARARRPLVVAALPSGDGRVMVLGGPVTDADAHAIDGDTRATDVLGVGAP